MKKLARQINSKENAPDMRRLTRLLCGAGLGLLAGCAALQEKPRIETVFAITGANNLVKFNAGKPGEVSNKVKITGLASGDSIVGIDFRPANGKLYALASGGRLYTVDTGSGAAAQVGSGNFAAQMNGVEYGFDFNPVVDRIRVVSNIGENMRLHPDTGAVVDSDPTKDGIQTDARLAYAGTDANAGKRPYVVSAAYTNSVAGAKATTNFAVDVSQGLLVTQGTREGATPAVSPNSGQLFTVGSLGFKASGTAAFDIAANGTAFAALTAAGSEGAKLYLINLTTGATSSLGAIGGGEAVKAIAVAP